jgi:hypothetical protein
MQIWKNDFEGLKSEERIVAGGKSTLDGTNAIETIANINGKTEIRCWHYVYFWDDRKEEIEEEYICKMVGKIRRRIM